jgi:hypothetical protein
MRKPLVKEKAKTTPTFRLPPGEGWERRKAIARCLGLTSYQSR